MSNIKRESWLPKQGTWLGRIVNVCVDYNTEHIIKGLIVREDEEHPGIMIIKLDSGEYLQSTECQYQLVKEI